MTSPRAFLEELFRIAVAAAHPATCLPPLLPQPGTGRVILLAAGKAAGSMAEVAEGFYLDRCKLARERLAGVAVARHGYGRPLRVVEMIEAGHPIPDAAGLQAADRALELADGATADDLVLVLMSGGASANWIAPAARRVVRRQAGGDARAAALGRQHFRDQLRAQTSLAHQRRAAGAPCTSGAACDHRHLRRAGRRPVRHRLGPDRARSHDAQRRARDRRKIQTRDPRECDARACRSRQRNAKAGRCHLRRQPVHVCRTAGGRLACGAKCGDGRRLRMRFARRPRRGRGARGCQGPCRARARAARRGQTRGHPLRRRIDRHHPRPRPRRAQPGICPGAGDCACPAWPASPASPPTPTAPTAAPA